MLGCYARDSLPTIHLSDVWSCTQEFWVKTYTFKSGTTRKTHPKRCGNAVPTHSRPTMPLVTLSIFISIWIRM